MKSLIFLFFIVSLGINICLGFLLMKKTGQIEDGVINEMILVRGLEDLSYFFRNSSLTKEKILDLSRNQPDRKDSEREQPVLNGNHFYRFPMEIIFSESGKIETVKIGDETY